MKKCSNDYCSLDVAGKFEEIGREIGKIVDQKNVAYGNSVNDTGDFLRLLFPDGISKSELEKFDDIALLVRIFDKQKRIANRKNAFGENPYRDIAGYGILGAEMSGKNKKEAVTFCTDIEGKPFPGTGRLMTDAEKAERYDP